MFMRWKKFHVVLAAVVAMATLPAVGFPAIVVPQTATAAGLPGCAYAFLDVAPGGYMTSTDASYTLAMQTDGNLVLYDSSSKPYLALWDTHTYGHPGAYLWLQGDGNLVIYSPSHTALWNTHTSGHPGAYLCLQTDGNLVIYSPSHTALWNIGLHPHPSCWSMPGRCYHTVPFAANGFQISMSSLQWWNGTSAGSTNLTAQCSTAWWSPDDCVYPPHQGSYWRQDIGAWEDWVTFTLLAPIPEDGELPTCVYLRSDVTPSGHMTAYAWSSIHLFSWQGSSC